MDYSIIGMTANFRCPAVTDTQNKTSKPLNNSHQIDVSSQNTGIMVKESLVEGKQTDEKQCCFYMKIAS